MDRVRAEARRQYADYDPEMAKRYVTGFAAGAQWLATELLTDRATEAAARTLGIENAIAAAIKEVT